MPELWRISLDLTPDEISSLVAFIRESGNKGLQYAFDTRKVSRIEPGQYDREAE